MYIYMIYDIYIYKHVHIIEVRDDVWDDYVYIYTCYNVSARCKFIYLYMY